MKNFFFIFFYFFFQKIYGLKPIYYMHGFRITHISNINTDFINIITKTQMKSIVRVNTILNFQSFRKGIFNNGILKSIFNDPDLREQWYFLKESSSWYLSHDLDKVWVRNITGYGVTVGILSGGVDINHRDLSKNYIANLSYNFVEKSEHVYPTMSLRATELAGLIAASSNNYKCGVGAAPSSSFSSLQIFDDKHYAITDSKLYFALSKEINKIAIYLLLFNIGYKNDIVNIPGPLTIAGLKYGNKYGRNGKGNIFLISPGRYHHEGSNCAFRALSQRPEIFVIGSILNDGASTDYSERCSAVLASAISTEAVGSEQFLYTTQNNNRCGKSIGGLPSISASIAAGIIALLLSENPLFTVRQVFIIIVYSSNQYDENAIKNAAGFLYSYSLGFGMLNAEEMIIISKKKEIKYLFKQNVCLKKYSKNRLVVMPNIPRRISIFSDGCVETKNCVTNIEQLLLTFTLRTYCRKAVTILMISPGGTKFKILKPRYYDNSSHGFDNWTLKVLGFFAENTIGNWKVYIYSNKFRSILEKMKIEFYGVCNIKTSQQQFSNNTNVEPEPGDYLME